uniref:Uncharacterized protein n=1 Tax=Triticum urartu TaxID=4572 RepID=A0A8R7R098_TRIUA
MKLSFLDTFHVATGPIQRLFFYDGPGLPPFPSVAGSLRSSLAATLPVFLPLAGKLAFRPACGDIVVDCSPSAVSSGVKFVEAEFLAGADALRRPWFSISVSEIFQHQPKSLKFSEFQ